MPVTTLQLDSDTWDLVVSPDANIATVNDVEGMQQSQDAASACRLFLDELWFDTTQGVPYWQQMLGKLPPISLIESNYATAAETVTNVKAASVTVTSLQNQPANSALRFHQHRTVTGTVTVTGTTSTGSVTGTASF